jgi:hypothetical protein
VIFRLKKGPFFVIFAVPAKSFSAFFSTDLWMDVILSGRASLVGTLLKYEEIHFD